MKKFYIILALLFVLICIFYIYEHFKSDPNSENNKEAYQALKDFYNAYIIGVNEAAKYVSGTNAGQLVNYRFYYGDIKSFKVEKITNVDETRKKGIVTVKTVKKTGENATYTDTIIMIYDNGKWLVEKYLSTSYNDWPKLP
ncbi:hypothetical protein QJ48_30425 [Paenibacillus sp. A3]|uniref:hypothetical protein n=1 Tax=Paenibacillus sp. A3 TaxID=1337054 RepID=UPI0006D53580|nr:hypothetical protein [Paenibacillus sp. A3]KPV55910.1 hypothetical protein QJ48_30425 [Paenibacillus sp. A3]